VAVPDPAVALGCMVDRQLLHDLVTADSAGSTRWIVYLTGLADLAVYPLEAVCLERNQREYVYACQVHENAVRT